MLERMEPMRKFGLEEIIPQESTFDLKATGRLYRLRAYTLGDAAWAHARYGTKVQGLFGGNPDPEMISAFAFQLMIEKDQDEFQPKPCVFRNADTGEKTPGMIGGAKLLAEMIKGPAEAIRVLAAIRESIGMSQSVIEKIKKKTEARSAGPELSSSPSTNGG